MGFDMRFSDIGYLSTEVFGEDTLFPLRQFYMRTRGRIPEEAKESLRMELIDIIQEIENSVIQELESRKRYSKERKFVRSWEWEISPSGDNHLIAIDSCFILITLYGLKMLVCNESTFLLQLGISHIRWIEEDHLLVFEMYSRSENYFEECICHYVNDSTSFVYFTKSSKVSLAKSTWHKLWDF